MAETCADDTPRGQPLSEQWRFDLGKGRGDLGSVDRHAQLTTICDAEKIPGSSGGGGVFFGYQRASRSLECRHRGNFCARVLQVEHFSRSRTSYIW